MANLSKLGLNAFIYKFFEYFIDQELPEIKAVDLYFNQFETDSNGETDARPNPRILIEILEAEPEQRFARQQTWVGEVIFHIGIDIFNTFTKSKNQDKNLEYLKLLDIIYSKLAYLSMYSLPDELQSNVFDIYNIERNRILMATNTGAIKISEIGFKFIIRDASADVETTTSEVLNSISTINTVTGVAENAIINSTPATNVVISMTSLEHIQSTNDVWLTALGGSALTIDANDTTMTILQGASPLYVIRRGFFNLTINNFIGTVAAAELQVSISSSPTFQYPINMYLNTNTLTAPLVVTEWDNINSIPVLEYNRIESDVMFLTFTPFGLSILNANRNSTITLVSKTESDYKQIEVTGTERLEIINPISAQLKIK